MKSSINKQSRCNIRKLAKTDLQIKDDISTKISELDSLRMQREENLKNMRNRL